MLTKWLAVTLAALLVPSVASAAFIMDDPDNPIRLSEVTPITSGDKVFSDFWVSGNAVSDTGAYLPPLEGILIYPGYDDLTGDIGLFFHTPWGVAPNQVLDFVFKFSVSIAPDPEYDEWFIKDVRMDLALAGADEAGLVNVVERVTAEEDNPATELGRATYWTAEGAPPDATYGGFEWDPPLKQIWVYKDILLSGGANGTAQLSGFYQYFSQIPEPSALVVLGLGAAVLAVRRRST